MELNGVCISPAMKTPYFPYIIAIAIVSTFFAGCQFDNGSVLSFIRRVSKIPIPNNITIISEYDQGELEAGGKYQLDQKDLESFLSKNNFRPVDQMYRYMCRFNRMGKAGLFPLSDTIPLADATYLKYFYGCKKDNSWLFTLNEKSGELWIEVQYPDWQGQGPACSL